LKLKILIVDDKPNTLKVLGAILEDEGYAVDQALNGEEALEIFDTEARIDAVVADLKMPGMDGLALYHELRKRDPDLPFVIMTAHGSVESAVSAMKDGVTNYLIKPLNYEELILVLQRSIQEKKMSRELADLRREIREKYSFQQIIGTHPKMKKIFERVKSVAPTDASVLVHGETGTGKELLAKAIHALSRRSERPMICINSAALTENLLEAELFGYVKGAFTGALTNKQGRLDSADGGTLFLDEIGHMSLHLQTKLLRFLQEGSYEPVGSSKTRFVDVRIIAATNLDLQEEIKAKRFLSDLLYRIEVLSITAPPLRERGDDVQLLVNHFIKHFAEEYKKKIDSIAPAAMDLLKRYSWPGNVRQLENCIARCVIFTKGRQIQLDDLPQIVKDAADVHPEAQKGYIRPLPEAGISLKALEKELIQKTLVKCKGNKSRTAGLLGLSRKALYEKIERYRIQTGHR
jgi:DNA-binding NtrC family response regulator